jgi:hypothetical protein
MTQHSIYVVPISKVMIHPSESTQYDYPNHAIRAEIADIVAGYDSNRAVRAVVGIAASPPEASFGFGY